MGCVCIKESTTTTSTNEKVFSWDRRENNKVSDYCIENCERKEIVKTPGSVNGQQFLLQNCSYTSIYIFDDIGTVTIDDCSNCVIILGAVKSSVFLRNCKDVVCIASCGQFRSRDSEKCHIFLSSATQPIIETSKNIKFSPLSLSYIHLQAHREKCNLAIAKFWTDVFDFTPAQGELNWSVTNLEDVRLKLKPKSTYSEKLFKELEVTWMGKAVHSAHESSV